MESWLESRFEVLGRVLARILVLMLVFLLNTTKKLAIFCVLRELIFTIRTDWFFLLRLIFAIYRKYPVPSTDNVFVFIEYVQ